MINTNLLIETLVYLFIGILIFILTILIVEKLTPWSLYKELVEDQNIAIAIMFAGFFISMAIIIGAAING